MVMQGMAKTIRVAPQAVRALTYAPALRCMLSSMPERSVNEHLMPMFQEELTIRKCLVQLVSRHSVFVLGAKSRCPILKGRAVWDCVCHLLIIHRAHLPWAVTRALAWSA